MMAWVGVFDRVFQEKWGGLEVQSRDDKWHHVEPVDGAIVVNIADCLQRWSNDVLRSTRHRVTVDPRIKGDDLPARHSIAVFCNPNKETLVEALPGTGPRKHAPINAYDYLIGRLNNTISK
jgi:isopenicillin N synthase-like dioxygenase